MSSEGDIEKYIEELGQEILVAEKDEVKESQLIRLAEIAKTYKGEDQLISSKEIAEIMRTRPPEKKMYSGFTGLDKILDGFRPQQLIVVSAQTKSGKTSFCIELTSQMVKDQPTWLPFEESAEELIQKFLDRGEEPPHFYSPARMKGDTLAWVEKKIIEARAKFDSKIIFIDHLHFIVPFSSDRQDLAIGQAMRELKRMAKTWNMVIVLIAHLKKTKVDMQPTLEDLRDSSFVAQEADTVLMLWRKAARENGKLVITDQVNVSVQANRRTGKTGNVEFLFKDGRFRETAWEMAEDFGGPETRISGDED